MPLTILNDVEVRELLHSLTKEDIINMQQTLGDALHYYSSGDDDGSHGCSADQQPSRIQIAQKSGATTLFMPGSSFQGIGVKIVTLFESSQQQRQSSVQSSFSGLSLTDSDVPPYPVASVESQSNMSSATLLSDASAPTSPSGTMILMDRNGNAKALINAAELTAFRTALASTIIFKKRRNVHDVLVFGAGKQAYWHARLALLLRGSDIHHLNVVNRSFENGVALMKALFSAPWPEGKPSPKTEVITPSHTEYDRHLKNLVRSAAAIFFTTPSTTPLFPPEILTNTEGRKKGRYLAAIGSYKPHMCEVHPDIIRQAVAPSHGHHHHFHRHAKTAGAVVVDSVEACLKEAGELIQAGVTGREVVELGELIMLKKDMQRRKSLALGEMAADEGVEMKSHLRSRRKSGSKDDDVDDDDDGGLKEWLMKGNVIYKSVGLALMDCAVGSELVNIANERKLGTIVPY